MGDAACTFMISAWGQGVLSALLGLERVNAELKALRIRGEEPRRSWPVQYHRAF
jgi:hypothetical protein